MPSDYEKLNHSVAFRVTESEWLKLQVIAKENGATVAQFAKALLFRSVKLRAPKRKKSPYGHTTAAEPRKTTRK